MGANKRELQKRMLAKNRRHDLKRAAKKKEGRRAIAEGKTQTNMLRLAKIAAMQAEILSRIQSQVQPPPQE